MQFRPGDELTQPASASAAEDGLPDFGLIERAVLGENGAANRDLFVNALFARSIDAYERVLRQLHATPGWTEASRIIANDVFRTFQVDIYSDAAISFTDSVEARYLKREM